MRDFLEDIDQHKDAGIGRADNNAGKPLPKRFYKTVTVVETEGGYAVALDGKTTKTPGRIAVVVPNKSLAEEIVREWSEQGEHIIAETMPMMRLVNSAIEGGAKNAAALADEIIKYAGGDALLYRADTPQELVSLQEETWDPVLVSLARRFEVTFQSTIGIMPQEQPAVTLEKLRKALPDNFLMLTALVSITGLTGSGLLALAIYDGLIASEAAWDVAHLDENYNARVWGEDAEVTARQAKRRKEFDAAAKMISLLRA